MTAVDRRLLVLAPTSRDGATAQQVLATAGVPVQVCGSLASLLAELSTGAAALLLAEEALPDARTTALRRWLADQPPWSDLPLLILARAGADSADLAEAVRTLGNVTLIERPVRVATLVSAVRTALRARARQYEIREHLAERAQAEAALRLADRRKDEFIATLGHELRNPLAPLLTGVHLLKAASADPETTRVQQIMERQVTHLVRLVDDLLDVSRVTRGLIEVRREPVDLATVLRAALETSQGAFESARLGLAVDIPAVPMPAHGDQVRLTQVFANLLTNAAKYTGAGGRVWLSARRTGDRWTVSVRDTGVGIPASHLESVFDMFTQVDGPGRGAQGGLGIGLTLARSLVEMHGGTIEARSAGPGTGSEFVVTLPATAAPALARGPVAAAGSLPPQRILIVDDNEDAGEMLATLLAGQGAEVSVARGGMEALAQLERFHPDSVLLDIGMPGMDGYEVARRIRDTPAYRDLLIIALTGWGQPNDRQRSREAGFDHHLVKPPDLDRLRTLLTEGRSAAGGGTRPAAST
ncbi:MAG: ATP-binding protein [Vicinamibacterales bacterium]